MLVVPRRLILRLRHLLGPVLDHYREKAKNKNGGGGEKKKKANNGGG